MNNQCRFILLVEYADDDALITGIEIIEKQLPSYDFASRPFTALSRESHFKFLAFKELADVKAFDKFAKRTLELQNKLHTLHAIPGYVSPVNAVTASYLYSPGAILNRDKIWLKLQLVFSEKSLMSHTLSDAHFKDKRSIVYLNDVWQLVRGEMR